jgi:hypothetical protein
MYSPYKRSSIILGLTLGYEMLSLPIAPSTVDLSWRTGKDYEKRRNPDNEFVKTYDNSTDNLTLGIHSRFSPIPLRTHFSISTGNQANSITDADNNNLNFLLKGEYWLLKNKVKPWAEYRITTLSGDQDSQAYNYLDFGVEANPFDYTTVSTSLGWRFYKNDDKDNADYTTTAWNLVVSQRF